MNKFSKKYLDIISTDFYGLNLTSLKTVEEIETHLYKDSLLPVESSEIFRKFLEESNIIVDIGFGGGFPLLPLAIRYSEKKFIGLEARRKKVEAVKLIAKKLDIKNVEIYHERLEKIKFDLPAIITFKAVGDIYELLKKIKATSIVTVFFYKGPKEKVFDFEKLKGWRKVEHIEMFLENVGERVLIGVQNINVPCGTKNKNLVNLSTII